MKATLPAVQFNCKHARRIVCYKADTARDDKRIADRRHFNRVTRSFVLDLDRFDSEGFDAPSLSSWDIC